MKERKPRIVYSSTGPSGNIFFILAEVKKEVTQEQFSEIWKEVQASSSYKQSLTVIRKYVDLLDIDGKE